MLFFSGHEATAVNGEVVIAPSSFSEHDFCLGLIDGELIGFTERGYSIFKPDFREFINTTASEEPFIPKTTKIIQSKDKSIWIGSLNGLFHQKEIYKKNTPQSFLKPNNQTFGRIGDLIAGRKNDIWVVEMPGGNGFDILDAFDVIDFKIIFVTGYDKYAIKAIKYAALDYLLKPIDVSELTSAVNKAISAAPNYNEQINLLKDNLTGEENELSQVVFSGDKNYQVVKINHILYVEADGNYVTFHMKDNAKYISSNSLSYYEDLLPISKFFRIHKSYIISINAVLSVENGRGGLIHLTDNTKLPVAFRRKSAFLQFLERNNAI